MDSDEQITPPSPPKATVEDEYWWCDESLLSDLAAWWGEEYQGENHVGDRGALKDGSQDPHIETWNS